MTVRDFMNYLIFIEHSAENLQFFLWYRDYERRFRDADTSDKSLAPEWTQEMEDEVLANINKAVADNVKESPEAAEIFKGTDFENPGDTAFYASDPFTTPPRTPDCNDHGSTVYSSQATTFHSQAQDTYAAAGSKQPCKL
jgi:L-rhamnose mutarotase